MKDYYSILEVPATATQEQIREQYYLLIQAWHPDKFRSPGQKAKAEERSKEVNIAYGVLKDPAKRAEYDRKLSGQPPPAGAAERPRPAEEHRRRKPTEAEQQRAAYEQQQRERAEAERRRKEQEAEAAAQEEWIRVFFEQARRRQSKQPAAKETQSHQAPIRVLVVDDVADTRMRTRKLLGSETEFTVVGEASNGVEAVEKFGALMPDVTTISMNLATLGGITVTEAIRRKYPLAKIILISGQSSTDFIRRAMLAGACDYLAQPPQAEELQSAVRLAAGREISASGKASAK